MTITEELRAAAAKRTAELADLLLTRAADEIERLTMCFSEASNLLRTSRCPNVYCDNRGEIVTYGAGGSFESESCAWCAKRAKALPEAPK